jgi:antirestriction protein ArdC
MSRRSTRGDSGFYLCAETGIPFNPEHQAQYVGNWIKVLQNDKNEFFKAARDASAVPDYILALEKGKTQGVPTVEEQPSHADRVMQSR